MSPTSAEAADQKDGLGANGVDLLQTNNLTKMSELHEENVVPSSKPASDNGARVSLETDAAHATAAETTADALEASPVDKFAYGMHKELEFDAPALYPGLHNDPTIVKFDSQNPELINHATVKALIVQLTSPEIVDYDLICDFFLTYRMFVSTEKVMDLLLTRLIWALQHIKSSDASKNKNGQLVLLRSFVVLRHWILNYFVDDFNSNFSLCDHFTSSINDMIFNSNLVDTSNVFETKILSDLKTHWLSSIIEFWDLDIDLGVISSEVYNYCLPLTSEVSISNKMKKSSTEMSLHTNPSYRRSAMLSLYDQKTYHKCLIIDDNQNDDNPQLSVNNLLLQHQSSRQSINKILQTYNEHSEPKKLHLKPLGNSTKHNRMNLKDSSIALKKTRKNESRRATHYDITVSNSTHPLTPMHLDNVGFATNGNIKIPSSKVNTIVPSTPVRKMEYVIRPPNHEFTSRSFLEELDLSRKKSLKRIVDSWKKSLNHNKYELANEANEDLHNLINDALRKSEDASLIGNRFDVLSARIIDELEFLIKGYLQNESTNHSVIHETEGNDFTTVHRSSSEGIAQHNDDIDIDDLESGIDLVSSPIQRSPNMSCHKSESANDLEEEVDINDLSELNLRKIDNLINEGEAEDLDDHEFKNTSKKSESNEFLLENFMNDIHEFSFQRPTSINWSYENEIELEISQTKQQSTESLRNQDPRASNNEFKEPQLTFNNSNKSFVSSISTPSNITQYHADIQDLGIAVSPTYNNNTRKISFHDSVVDKRYSKASTNSILKRDSAKSYLSYDSAFSVSRGTGYDNTQEGNLRKKAGVNDLRILAGLPAERQSLDKPVRIMSTSSRLSSSSTRKSIRVSTLFALTQLPFNNSDDSRSSIHGRRFTRVSDLGDSSVFSVAIRSAHISKETNEENAIGETFEKSSSSSGGSVAIPGISHHVLKELAAIPDESFDFNDPVGFALNKLEGKKKSFENPERSPSVLSQDTHVDDTEDILDAINNANTEDVIETEAIPNRVFTPEPPLTPVGKADNGTPMTSTPKKDDDYGNDIAHNDTTVSAQNENVFVFSANYSDPTTTGSRSLYNSRSQKTPKLILDNYNLVNDALSCSNIIGNNLHISFIFAHNSQSLAEHFTVIERDILQEIDWKELIELKWNKDIRPVNSWLEIIVNEEYHSSNKGVNLTISRFNLMVNWIISQILLTKNQEERIKIICRFIHIGQDCLELQNYSTLMQIILALTSEKITKLKETWKNLPPGDILMLKSLEELASPMKNFMNLRVSINQIQPSRGCIPFVGLYLSDLIFNTERPKLIANKHGGEQLVNFSRFRTSVHIVKSLSQCIEWSLYYQIEIDSKLLSKCLYLKSLDEDEMNYCIASIDSP